MRILVDENMPLMTVHALRESGNDVLDIRGTSDKGATDDVLWEIAKIQGRLLITTDKGFSNRRDEKHYGVLIVRLRQPNRNKIHHRVIQAMTQFDEKEWPGLLVVMRDMVQSIWRAKQ